MCAINFDVDRPDATLLRWDAANPRFIPSDGRSGPEREVRTRMVDIQVSVSQTASEKEPLVSVSSTWGGREQVTRVLAGAEGPD